MEDVRQKKKNIIKMISRSIRLWFALSIMLAAVFFLLYKTEKNAQQVIFKANAKRVMHSAIQTIHSEMKILHGDVLYLASLSLLQDWLTNKNSSIEKHIKSDLSAFASQRRIYDQIRYVDERGNEVVRINWKQDGSIVVPKKYLQNKSKRYYIKNILRLNRNEVYASPFDLNIENNKIEMPIKPVLRIGTPVLDKNGDKRGAIVLNYLGKRLLRQLQEIKRENSIQIWLLNAKGFWLLGPRPEMEWGFMYPDRSEDRFKKLYPEVWRAIQSSGKSGQLVMNDNLYTYTHVGSGISRLKNKAQDWLLVTYIPKAMFANSLAARQRSFIISYVLLSALLAMISWLITHKEFLRKKSENAIRESEARFRALLDSAPDAIVIVNESGHINLVNSQTEKWFGYGRQELTGKPIEKLIPARYHSDHIHSRDDYISNPAARPMGQGLELFGLRKDGSEIPVEISLSPLQTENGTFVTSIIRDITARKLAEQAKHQIEMRYHELVNNLPVGIYRNTPGDDGCFLEVNPAMAIIFDAESNEQLLKYSVRDLYCNPEERIAFSEKILHQGYVTSEELHLKTLKGREFCAAITAVKKQHTDGSIYFDGIVEDITIRKENECQIQRLNDSLRARTIDLEAINHELEAFSYSVSHDLRAPLRAIDGFSHMLMNNYADKLDDKGRDRLSRIRAGAQRMALLIDDMLKLSRVSRTELCCEEVDLSEISCAVIEELRNIDPGREVNFVIQEKLNVTADPQLLRVIMDNLIGNAWKFTGQTSNAMIEVGRRMLEEGECFFVQDNGAGFDMAYADKLFGAFQRLHDSGEFPGTGIGLATVQRIINKHGGHIWAESSVELGATFYFKFTQEPNNEWQGDITRRRQSR